MVNNTGVIEAQTLNDVTGKVVLYAHGGTANVSGTIDATGGFVETSGENLKVADGTVIKAKKWLLDPTNIIVASGGTETLAGTPATTSTSGDVTVSGTTIQDQLNAGTSVLLDAANDITINEDITTAPSADTSLTFKAGRNITLNNSITASSNKLNIQFWADSDNSGDGINIIKGSNITTNGGSLTFGNGSAILINGVSTLVGGDVYFNSLSKQTLSTGGGAVNIQGAAIIANSSGLDINTAGGNVTFSGLLDAGNSYEGIHSSNITWTDAKTVAKGTTAGERATGDTYLATITSPLENAISGQSVNYTKAWLGGERVTGIGTDGYWRWVTGPEGLQDSGRGSVFFQQTGPGTGTSVGYSNWNPQSGGEPNNNADGHGPYPISNPSETALQFTGTAGQWNDLSSSNTGVSWYVKETNLAASPLTINAGSGNVILGGAVGSNKALASLNITAGTTAINGGNVTTEGLQTYTSNVTLGAAATTLVQTTANTDFTFQNNKSFTNAVGGNATLLVKTTGDILMTKSSSITSSAGTLGITFNSDSDGTDGGGIALFGATLNSNGGNITFGGGTAGDGSGYAQGLRTTTNYISDIDSPSAGNMGITIGNSTITAAGGSISMKGQGRDGDGTIGRNKGIELIGDTGRNVSVTTTGTGTITFDGLGGPESSSENVANYGVNLNNSSGTGTITVGTANGALSMTGVGGGTGTINSGVMMEGSGNTIKVSSTGGAINITGTAGTGASSYGIKSASNTTVGGGSTGAITLTADTVSLSGSYQSTGSLTVKPLTAATTIGIAGGAGILALSAANFSTNFVNGFSGITVGSSLQSGNIAIGATAFNDALTLYTTGAVTQTGAITGNQNLNLLGTGGSYTLTNTANNVATLTANTGSVSYVDSDALSVGAITATGAVNIVTQSGDMTLTGAIATTDTSTTALTLNAGKTAAAGTATGGDVKISGGTISVGAGGRATLYSGSIASSTGLSTLLGSGSGRFRYNSDETSPGYTTALGTGIYAIYREQPTLSITPSTASSTYGSVVSVAGVTETISGYQNGDDATDAGISGSAVFTSTATSTSNAGTYNIAYSSGLSNGVGYAIADRISSTDEYTIAKAAATVTANSDLTKVYNGVEQNVAGFTASGLVNGETIAVLSGVSGATASGTNVGTYNTALAGTDKNYNLTFVNGKLTILPRLDDTIALTILPRLDNIITTIANQTIVTSPAYTVIAPSTPQQTVAEAQTTQLLQNIMPQSQNGERFNLVGSTDGVDAAQTVSMEQLQKASKSQGVNEIRVALGQDSFVELVNGGVNLPQGLSQEFYVVSNLTPRHR
jgi:hypothetical protein